MAPGRFRFERFVLDPRDRRLTRDDAPVELNSRYLDALALLVSEPGRLVSKDRFLDEVWRGVPVTDEALTQCIRTLRRQLGDDAGRPRFIETVPKHGYRFIAPVERLEPDEAARPGAGAANPVRMTAIARTGWRRTLLLGAAGMAGGGAAGFVGGMFYGLVGAAQPAPAAVGAVSIVLVLAVVTGVVGLIGGAGVGFGMATAGFGPGGPWLRSLIGGAGGGLIVGAVVKLLGLDAFNLLFGHAPGGITGAGEGALLGGAIGLGAWLGSRGAPVPRLRLGMAAAGLGGAVAGALIPQMGGRLMGGSLDLLARSFPASRLRLDHIGGAFGEAAFGPISQSVTGAAEGMLFGACVAGAMILAGRALGDRSGRAG